MGFTGEPDALELCKHTDFLAKCVAKAGFDEELRSDVLDAAEISSLTALDLAVSTAEEAAQQLFLVIYEARYEG